MSAEQATAKQKSAGLSAIMKLSDTGAAIERQRLLSYGTAAASLVIVVQLLQVSTITIPLQVALVCAAISMPLCVMFAMMNECYLMLGEGSFKHFVAVAYGRFGVISQAVALASFFVEVIAVLWHLFPIAAAVFCIASVLAVIFAAGIWGGLSSWWFSEHGPVDKTQSIQGIMRDGLTTTKSGASNQPGKPTNGR